MGDCSDQFVTTHLHRDQIRELDAGHVRLERLQTCGRRQRVGCRRMMGLGGGTKQDENAVNDTLESSIHLIICIPTRLAIDTETYDIYILAQTGRRHSSKLPESDQIFLLKVQG